MAQEHSARDFLDASETGKGWEACKVWCHPEATFSCQADALADTKTLAAYADWMKGLLSPIPDGHYVLKAFAVDAEKSCVVAAAEFHATQTGTGGGAVPPTGKSVVSDYAHVMQFNGDKIRHMTKIWNDLQALRQLGWA